MKLFFKKNPKKETTVFVIGLWVKKRPSIFKKFCARLKTPGPRPLQEKISNFAKKISNEKGFQEFNQNEKLTDPKEIDEYLLEMIIKRKKDPYHLLVINLRRGKAGIYRALVNDIHKWDFHFDNATGASKRDITLDDFESK